MARLIKLMGKMILSMVSVVFGGVLNMLFVKTPLFGKIRKPIDGGRNWSDGRRIFGENKTYAGVAGMTVGTMVSQVCMGLLLKALGLSHLSDVYRRHENTVKYNALAGGLFGFAYVLFELPNSCSAKCSSSSTRSTPCSESWQSSRCCPRSASSNTLDTSPSAASSTS